MLMRVQNEFPGSHRSRGHTKIRGSWSHDGFPIELSEGDRADQPGLRVTLRRESRPPKDGFASGDDSETTPVPLGDRAEAELILQPGELALARNPIGFGIARVALRFLRRLRPVEADADMAAEHVVAA